MMPGRSTATRATRSRPAGSSGRHCAAAERVATVLGGDLTMGAISQHELQRAKRARPTDLRAYDYLQLGKKARLCKESIPRGIELLTKAVEVDPTVSRACSVRAWLHFFSIPHGADGATAIERMIADAEKAVALDRQDAKSLATLNYARIFQGCHEEAEAAFQTAVDMSPANSHVLILAASGSSTAASPKKAPASATGHCGSITG
jgi:tetratricopeptide (TPR) repeat protein